MQFLNTQTVHGDVSARPPYPVSVELSQLPLLCAGRSYSTPLSTGKLLSHCTEELRCALGPWGGGGEGGRGLLDGKQGPGGQVGGRGGGGGHKTHAVSLVP